MNGHSIQSSNSQLLLPSVTGVVNYADISDKATFAMVTNMKEEPMDVESLDTNKDEVGFNFRLQTTNEI